MSINLITFVFFIIRYLNGRYGCNRYKNSIGNGGASYAWMQKGGRATTKVCLGDIFFFRNTIGGTILLGISEHLLEAEPEKRFEFTGVANPQKMKKEFFDILNSNKVNRNILTDKDVEIIAYDGGSLLCIHVPQADYRQRPIYINGNMMNGSFKRNFEGDYHCTEDEVKAIMAFAMLL